MLQLGKLSQILECYNKGNKARYWNVTTGETGPYTNGTTRENIAIYWKVAPMETESDTGMLHKREKSQIVTTRETKPDNVILQLGK